MSEKTEERKKILSPELKKEFEEAGFEDNAAVVIGNKEEMERARERIETEGRTKDLKTYIKMHKNSVVVPRHLFDSMDAVSQIMLSDKNSGYGEVGFYGSGIILNYIDKDGNLAEVKIDAKLIDDYKKLSGHDVNRKILRDLSDYDFNITPHKFAMNQYYLDYLKKLQKEIAERAKEKGIDKFDF
ncbi:MAG: hypothetical protein COV30_02480 [Candidatus Yanofskybacteria bacterium CG10_big_fil_rev_8_21_14_0_10_37_15]|uniref:Uncharacterized protein n=1 Tax=Candidatus Yanofskybacteria bacterium CG10_big_fil_rev_8_21_14_0_10_37_15 TaxID=1975097 RepID=A0A2H0R786_9BACT|nr:MAG: hypothetical protein COV30_02480 [Candidatus Yanofskybacteria bacterium CG10_big_fil_rev_8_21_14_0_10_37_15]